MGGPGRITGHPWHFGGNHGNGNLAGVIGDGRSAYGFDCTRRFIPIRGVDDQVPTWDALFGWLDRYWPRGGGTGIADHIKNNNPMRIELSFPVLPTGQHTTKTSAGRVGGVLTQVKNGLHAERYRAFARGLQARIAGTVHENTLVICYGLENNQAGGILESPFQMDCPDIASWKGALATVIRIFREECPGIGHTTSIFPTQGDGTGGHVLDRLPLDLLDYICLHYGSMLAPNDPVWSIDLYDQRCNEWADAARTRPKGWRTWFQWGQRVGMPISIGEHGTGEKQRNNGAYWLGVYKLLYEVARWKTPDGRYVLHDEKGFFNMTLNLANGMHPHSLQLVRKLWGRSGGFAPDLSAPGWNRTWNWRRGPPPNYLQLQ